MKDNIIVGFVIGGMVAGFSVLGFIAHAPLSLGETTQQQQDDPNQGLPPGTVGGGSRVDTPPQPDGVPGSRVGAGARLDSKGCDAQKPTQRKGCILQSR